jgi:hypothetical protein
LSIASIVTAVPASTIQTAERVSARAAINATQRSTPSYAGQAGCKCRTGNITHHYVINVYRQASSQWCESLLPELVVIDTAGANNSIIVENTPFQSSVANID